MTGTQRNVATELAAGYEVRNRLALFSMNTSEQFLARIAALEAEVQSLRGQLADRNAASDAAAPAANEVSTAAHAIADTAILDSVLESSKDCIKIISLDGELSFMSGGGKQVMEVDDFEKIRGRYWPDFWPGDGKHKAEEAIASARAGKAAFFEGPAPTAKGTPRYWEVYVVPVPGPDGAVSRILSISRDVTERHRSQQQRDMFARELHHRVNNTLAIVSAITSQSIRTAVSLQDAELAIAGRIRALAQAHTLLVDERIILTTVGEVIKNSLAAYDEGAGRITLDGPDVNMSSRPSISLALAINELATNATKYGSLSQPGGRVAVTWTVEADRLRLVWSETGGPAVSPPERKSFGTTLIRSTFGGHMGGNATCDFEPAGVQCVFDVPLAALVEEV
jgi:PAS domain S-box-containing protein